MREILFRGRRVDNGKWIEGYLTYKYEGLSAFYVIGENVEECNRVIPETVGQYTGLKDKNEVKIFEGDKLTTNQYPCVDDGEQNYILEVAMIYNCWQVIFRLVNENKRGISDGVNNILNEDGYDEIASDLEVIGTIHDNNETT